MFIIFFELRPQSEASNMNKKKLTSFCKQSLNIEITQETCPDRGSNPGPLRDKRACYHLLQSGGLKNTEIKVEGQRFSNYKAPCTFIWQQPLQSLLVLWSCGAKIYLKNKNNCLNQWYSALFLIALVETPCTPKLMFNSNYTFTISKIN